MATRQGLAAVLFLGVLLFGGFTLLFGSLKNATACQGYTRPEVRALAKESPDLPHRRLRPKGTDVVNGAPAQTLDETFAQAAAKADSAASAALEDQHFFIQLYGGVQTFLGRTYVEDQADPAYGVAKLPGGALTFVAGGEADTQAEVAELKRLQTALSERRVPLLYLQAPSKLSPDAQLPYSLEDTGNRSADALLSGLDQVGVDCLDLRDTFAQADGDWLDHFYTTDHHWTTDGAFLAFQALSDKLSDYTYRSPRDPDEQEPQKKIKSSAPPIARDPEDVEDDDEDNEPRPILLDAKFTDPENYDRTVLSNFFLGSQGKRVGSLYGGVDDFTLWTPKFPTLLHYNINGGENTFGSATQTVLFPQRVERRDWFGGNPYTFYSGGDYGGARITNYYNPNGPRVLLVRESFAGALTPFLAYACSDVITMDFRYPHENLLSCVDWYKPDLVIVMYSAGTTRTESNFRLLSQPQPHTKSTVLRWDQPLRDVQP